MLDSYFTWNGVSSDSLNLIIRKEPGINSPRRKYDKFSVPGRNGDYINMQDAWEDGTQEYEITFGKGFGSYDINAAAHDVASWLYGVNGHAQLSDSYDPDFVREAYFIGPLDVENRLCKYGTAKISFGCKPQRFYASGLEFVSFGYYGDLTNPSVFTAHPIIKVTTTEHPRSLFNPAGRTAASVAGQRFNVEKYNKSADINLTASRTNGLIIEHTGTGNTLSVYMGMPVRQLTTYSIAFNRTGSGYVSATLYDNFGRNLIGYSITGEPSYESFTTPAGAAWLEFKFSVNAGNTLTLTNIQVQRGTAADPTQFLAPLATPGYEHRILKVQTRLSDNTHYREIEIVDPVGEVTVDCDLHTAYDYAGTLETRIVKTATKEGKWPALLPGRTGVDYSINETSALTHKGAIPRWWTL